MFSGKNHSSDVNNQSLEQIYMDKLEKFKMEDAMCKNAYNDRAKRPPAFLKS